MTAKRYLDMAVPLEKRTAVINDKEGDQPWPSCVCAGNRFRHDLSHTWLDRGGAERDLMELNGWTSRRCSPARAPAPAPAAATTGPWTTAPDPGHDASRTSRARTPVRRTPGPARATRPTHARHGYGRLATQDLTRRPHLQSTRPKPCPAAAPDRDHGHHVGSPTTKC